MLTLEDLKEQINPNLSYQLFYGLVEKKDITGYIDTIKWELISFTKDSFHKYKLSKKYPLKDKIPKLEKIESIDVQVETFKEKFKKYYINENKTI